MSDYLYCSNNYGHAANTLVVGTRLWFHPSPCQRGAEPLPRCLFALALWSRGFGERICNCGCHALVIWTNRPDPSPPELLEIILCGRRRDLTICLVHITPGLAMVMLRYRTNMPELLGLPRVANLCPMSTRACMIKRRGQAPIQQHPAASAQAIQMLPTRTPELWTHLH